MWPEVSPAPEDAAAAAAAPDEDADSASSGAAMPSARRSALRASTPAAAPTLAAAGRNCVRATRAGPCTTGLEARATAWATTGDPLKTAAAVALDAFFAREVAASRARWARKRSSSVTIEAASAKAASSWSVERLLARELRMALRQLRDAWRVERLFWRSREATSVMTSPRTALMSMPSGLFAMKARLLSAQVRVTSLRMRSRMMACTSPTRLASTRSPAYARSRPEARMDASFTSWSASRAPRGPLMAASRSWTCPWAVLPWLPGLLEGRVATASRPATRRASATHLYHSSPTAAATAGTTVGSWSIQYSWGTVSSAVRSVSRPSRRSDATPSSRAPTLTATTSARNSCAPSPRTRQSWRRSWSTADLTRWPLPFLHASTCATARSTMSEAMVGSASCATENCRESAGGCSRPAWAASRSSRVAATMPPRAVGMAPSEPEVPDAAAPSAVPVAEAAAAMVRSASARPPGMVSGAAPSDVMVERRRAVKHAITSSLTFSSRSLKLASTASAMPSS
mmetsp:Transcript_4912/g.21028  ORF Transcript_4912/g.21028 Transcript_4912/m.21028 type:complete len:515 (-) Transcript_4912:1137-2681(-)